MKAVCICYDLRPEVINSWLGEACCMPQMHHALCLRCSSPAHQLISSCSSTAGHCQLTCAGAVFVNVTSAVENRDAGQLLTGRIYLQSTVYSAVLKHSQSHCSVLVQRISNALQASASITQCAGKIFMPKRRLVADYPFLRDSEPLQDLGLQVRVDILPQHQSCWSVG